MLVVTFTYLPLSPSDNDSSLLGSLSAVVKMFHHPRTLH
jgi:hypothetical protein